MYLKERGPCKKIEKMYQVTKMAYSQDNFLILKTTSFTWILKEILQATTKEDSYLNSGHQSKVAWGHATC